MNAQEIQAEIDRLTAVQEDTNDPVFYYEIEMEIDGLFELLAGDGT